MRCGRAWLGIVASCAGAFAAAPALAAAGAQVVTLYVLSYSGPASVWHIERGTQHLAPKNGLALQPADCITLDASAAQSAAMTVVVDGREIAVSHANPHYCVSADAPQNPVLAAIGRSFASLAGVFHDAESDYNTQSTTSAVSRGGPFTPHIAMPLLGQDDQRVVAGNRALALVWAPGKAPYTVTVALAGAASTLVSATSETNTVRLAAASYAAGSYVVTVRDAKNVAGEKRFTVVPESALPAPTADEAAILADPATPADVRAAFDAARLMNDSSDAWRLEAYQRVVGHGGSELARRLIYQLENDG